MTHQAGRTAAPDGTQLIQTPTKGNARRPHTSSGADGLPLALFLLSRRAVASSTKRGTFGRSAEASQAMQGTISNLRGKDRRRGKSLLVLPGWGSMRAKDPAWDLGGVTYSKNTMVGLRIRRQLREHVHSLQRWRQLRRQAGRGATLGDIVTLEVASSARLSGSGYP